MKLLYFFVIIGLLFFTSCSSSINSDENDNVVVTANSTPKSPQKNAVRTIAKPHLKVDTTISLDYIMGKFDPIKHPKFIQVPPKYANGRKDRWLRKETYEAFLAMYEAAQKEGVELKILSATRNFAAQKSIWEGKWTGKRLHESKENLAKTTPDPTKRALKILRWSSMPSTSRHHWGTDMDLNAFTNDFFAKGKGLKMYNWMVENAATYGFCQPYSPKNAQRPNGYNEEKWHWSYLPLALPLTQQADLRLKDDMITGFLGAETAPSIKVVDKFILGINEACK